MIKKPSIVASWDFSQALGNTISEKWESLYIKLCTVGNLIWHKHSEQADTLNVSEKLSGMFEIKRLGNESDWVGRWFVNVDKELPDNQIYVGIGCDIDPQYFARLTVIQFEQY